jgi:hypothetical protein
MLPSKLEAGLVPPSTVIKAFGSTAVDELGPAALLIETIPPLPAEVDVAVALMTAFE